MGGVKETSYSQYQSDPVGFAKDVLGITVTKDVASMLESVRDNRITVCRSATGTGKSHGASVAAIWFYKCFPESRCYTIANPYENQKILWSELTSMVALNQSLFKTDKSTSFHIERSAKDFITALTVPTSGTEAEKESKFSGKHNPNMLFIVDEGDTVPGFAYKGVEGCMSGGFVRLLILFNPRYEAGTPYRHERDKTAKIIHLSAFSHPNVITGRDIIPGAVDRNVTVQRINEWCRPLLPQETDISSAETFELPEYLEGATGISQAGFEYPPLKAGRYKIIESSFSYMVLGEYPAQGSDQLVSREWINRARTRWDAYVETHGEIPPVGVYGVQGLDVADMGDDENVCCFRYGGYVEKLMSWGGVDSYITGELAAKYYHERKLTECNVDAIGVGAGVAAHMRAKGCNAHSIMVSERPTQRSTLGEFRILRDQLWWSCREWLRTDTGSMLPPDEELIEELIVPTYTIDNGKVRIMPKDDMKKHLRRSPNKADALCLTFGKGGLFAGCDLT